jgi:SAM-dependent methyltransferase
VTPNLRMADMVDINIILALCNKPAPFERYGLSIWTDPRISPQMLQAHLDPNFDAASRRPEVIERIIEWILSTVRLGGQGRALDLGCGPGLYAQRLARRGLQVTGVDISRSSLDYARAWAEAEHLSIEYRVESYLELQDEGLYDLALLIYGDYCTFSLPERQRLLSNARRALKPGGYFVLDVTTRHHRLRNGLKNGWRGEMSGFWRTTPCVILEQGFDYPEQDVYLDQYIVLDQDGSVSAYRNWFQDFTREGIIQELEAGGFTVLGAWSDLEGTPYHPDTEWIGVVAHVGEEIE